jgi:hypothetical protein
MRAGEYAQVCSALQLNKAISVHLEIRDNTKSTLEEIKGREKTFNPDMRLISGRCRQLYDP